MSVLIDLLFLFVIKHLFSYYFFIFLFNAIYDKKKS